MFFRQLRSKYATASTIITVGVNVRIGDTCAPGGDCLQKSQEIHYLMEQAMFHIRLNTKDSRGWCGTTCPMQHRGCRVI